MYERRINDVALIRFIEEIIEQRDVPMAAADHIARAILVEHKNLARRPPAERANRLGEAMIER